MAFGESKLGPGQPVSKEGVEQTSEAWGSAIWTGLEGKGGAVATISLTCPSLVESLGSVTIWAGRWMGTTTRLP